MNVVELNDLIQQAKSALASLVAEQEDETIEASELQLKPGSWPGVITHNGVEYVRCEAFMHGRGEGEELGGYFYRHFRTGGKRNLTLTVYND